MSKDPFGVHVWEHDDKDEKDVKQNVEDKKDK